MSFNVIRENKILAKISEFTVMLNGRVNRQLSSLSRQFDLHANIKPDYGS